MRLFKQERKKNEMKKAILTLRKHIGLSDLLTYLIALDDHTLLHKDGALSRHYKYEAPDLESSTDADLDYNAETWKNALSFLGNGWMIETNVISQRFTGYSQAREFPELVSALIDDERRLQYQEGHYYKNTMYLSLSFKSEDLLESKLKRFAVTEENPRLASEWIEEALKAFDQKVKEVIGYLARVLKIAPLCDHELTTYVHQCITGHRHSLAKPTLGHLLDAYVARDDFVGGFEPRIGKHFIKVLALDDLPSVSFPCILDRLSYFPLDYRWSSRFITLDRLTAKAYLKRYERNWSSQAIGVLGVFRESLGLPTRLNEDAENTAHLLREAQTQNSQGSVGYGFYTSVLVLMHEDKEFLQKVSDELITAIQQLDFRVREESVNATEAYLGSLPGHGDYNLRKLMVDTNYISHAFPTSSVFQGQSECPCDYYGRNQPPLLFTATLGRRPFLLNLHVGDVGHTAILGPTGKGKTTLCGALMTAHRKYSGSRIIVLDKDYSNRVLIKALGGAYYDLANNDCAFSPLSRVSFETPYEIDKALLWLMDACKVQGLSLTPERQRCLREALERLANESPLYKNLNHLALQEPELRQVITNFNAGWYQALLNGTDTAFSGNDILGFNMGILVKDAKEEGDCRILVIKAILNELEVLFNDRRPTLLILEEAWCYLKHPLLKNAIEAWWQTLRKFNVAVIFISTDLTGIVKSDMASILLSSCPTRIYLPNEAAFEMKSTYEAYGLNERQIEIIGKAQPKVDYYYQSVCGNRLFQLDLNELAKAFLCVASKEDLATFDELFSPENPRWILQWLSYKGLNEWAEFTKRHYLGAME